MGSYLQCIYSLLWDVQLRPFADTPCDAAFPAELSPIQSISTRLILTELILTQLPESSIISGPLIPP
ncbi:hypothetical protein VTO73DRAFT_14938 [Trametes versicolor]